jgi:hypothetical protein
LDDEEMGLTDLTSEQKDMVQVFFPPIVGRTTITLISMYQVVRFVDIDCDGKIDYREFFEAIFRGHYKERVRTNSLIGTWYVLPCPPHQNKTKKKKKKAILKSTNAAANWW